MPNNSTHEIVVQPREITGKASKRLRRQELIPGVVYGHKIEPENVQVAKRDFDHVYLRAGSNSLVDLKVGDKGKAHKVFIHEVQRNPLNHQVTHIDFVAVNLLEEMTVEVPIIVVGESPIVHNGQGMMLRPIEHITVKALPMDIPSLIEVDISGLTEIDQAIHVSDLELPDKVTLLSHPDDLIVKITEMPALEVVEEEAPTEGEGAEAQSEQAETSAEESGS